MIKSIVSVILASVLAFGTGLYLKAANPAAAEIPEGADASVPAKYFTISFDDGITQDYKIMEICRKYGFSACTFNLNTGLCGEHWDWVADMINVPGVTHNRLTREEIRDGAYKGFDLAVHGVDHPSMKNYDDDPLGIFNEVQLDAFHIYRWTGVMPVGMAWPGGDTEYTEETMKQVCKYTSIRFARGTTSTHTFAMPSYFMKWQPSCSILDPDVLEMARKFLDAPCDENMIFYVWGHGYELDAFNKYETLESLIKMMAEDENVVCISNSAFYRLFSDEIPSLPEE